MLIEGEFVSEFRYVPAHQKELRQFGVIDHLVCDVLTDSYDVTEPRAIDGQELQQEAVDLGERVARADRAVEVMQGGVDIAVVLSVARLVEKRGVIIESTKWFDDQVDLTGRVGGEATGSGFFFGRSSVSRWIFV